ncbi:hypothetical protein [Thermocrinis sp.]|uniref:hypothetical protein n=1 Tax=Thermocrinis sp. TaxID=2024383 RepID=UPI003C0CF7F8
MQEIIHFSTIVEHFSLKRIWTDEGTLDKEFLELLNGKLEEGMRVQEFLAEYGKAFRAEDVKRFKGIEKLLSVPQPTISRWLSEGGPFFYSVEHFSVKSVFMEDGKCPQEPVWVCIFLEQPHRFA